MPKSKSTPMYDDDPALIGGQSRLPDVVQKAIIKKKMRALRSKEKTSSSAAGLLLPAAIGAVSAEDDPLKGAAGGVLGGVIGAPVGALAASGLALPPSIAMALKNKGTKKQRIARARRIGRRAGLASAVLGGYAGSIYGAYKGGKKFGKKKKEKEKKSSAFNSYMDKMAAHGAEYDDHHMLSKSLERLAAQAMHLKDKLDSGLMLPSWAEYKIYKAYDSINSALGASYPGKYTPGGPAVIAMKTAAHCNTGPAHSKKKKKKPMRKKASVEQDVLSALTAEGGAAGMGALKKRVSSPDLVAAVKRLMAQGKIRKHRDGDIIKN